MITLKLLVEYHPDVHNWLSRVAERIQDEEYISHPFRGEAGYTGGVWLFRFSPILPSRLLGYFALFPLAGGVMAAVLLGASWPFWTGLGVACVPALAAVTFYQAWFYRMVFWIQARRLAGRWVYMRRLP